MRRRYLANETDIEAIPTFKDQDALNKLASPIMTAVVANVLVLEARPPLVSALPSNEED